MQVMPYVIRKYLNDVDPLVQLQQIDEGKKLVLG